MPNSINSTKSEDTTPNNLLNAYFIDVGQGDACLLEQNGHFMLIDAGDNTAEQTIVNFLKEKKVDELDFVVATHPHADHIGGLDAVLDAFSVDEIYMPKIVADTKTFEDVLDSVERQHLQVNTPVVGTDFQFADTNVEILAPIQNYEDLNNHSVVLRMTCQDTTFLFTGDMETESEMDVLSSGHEISADILKVGHHGSETSTSQAFPDAVNPKIAIISVGADNSYGHPTETVLNRLEDNDIQLYRTDQNGTIHVMSDGYISCKKCNP